MLSLWATSIKHKRTGQVRALTHPVPCLDSANKPSSQSFSPDMVLNEYSQTPWNNTLFWWNSILFYWMVPCFDEMVPCSDEMVPCFDEMVPCFNETVPCLDAMVPCLNETVPCFNGIVPCFNETVPCFSGIVPCFNETVLTQATKDYGDIFIGNKRLFIVKCSIFTLIKNRKSELIFLFLKCPFQ